MKNRTKLLLIICNMITLRQIFSSLFLRTVDLAALNLNKYCDLCEFNSYSCVYASCRQTILSVYWYCFFNIIQSAGRYLRNISTSQWLRFGQPSFAYLIINLLYEIDCLCGLVVRVPGYRSRGPGFDSQRYHIF
jgi:hypothetical protein